MIGWSTCGGTCGGFRSKATVAAEARPLHLRGFPSDGCWLAGSNGNQVVLRRLCQGLSVCVAWKKKTENTHKKMRKLADSADSTYYDFHFVFFVDFFLWMIQPVRNNLMIATVKTSAADLVAQCMIERKPITEVDWKRNLVSRLPSG